MIKFLHLLLLGIVIPSLVVSAMPSPRPVARLAPEVMKEIKGALNSNMPNLVLKLLRDNSLGVNSQLTDKRETALHLAAELGVQQAAEVLLGQGAKVNVRDDEGRSPLAYAQTNGHTQLAELLQIHAEAELSLLQKEKTSDAQDLFAAAKNNDRASAELLLAEGANPKEQKVHGHTTYDQLGFKTPFHVAFDAGHYSLAAILLKEAMGINGLDDQGWTPLMIAILADDWDLVRELLNDGANIMAGHIENALDIAKIVESEKKLLEVMLEQGADLNMQSRYGETALIRAARFGRIEIVRYLVEHGADLSVQDKSDNTALMWATHNRQTGIVKYLVEQGAEVNAQTESGWTALMRAARNGYTGIVKYLVEQGAEVNIQNRYGGTALERAAGEGHIDIVRYLVEQGADVNVQDEWGTTALTQAVQKKHMDIVRYLIEQGADVNIRVEWETTALIYAAQGGNIDIVRLLVEQGADLNAQNKDGKTALLEAARGTYRDIVGYIDIVKYLVEQGADLNAQDKYGNTALLWAAREEHIDIVKYLVEQGADITIQNRYGKTILDFAKDFGNQEITDILRSAQEQQASKPAA